MAGRVDILHLHDWQAGPAAIFRELRYADDPIDRPGGDAATTLHNLAYHGWAPNAALAQLGPATRRRRARPESPTASTCWPRPSRVPSWSTRSRPGTPREALTPEFGMGLDGPLRARGDRFFGILNGLDTAVWDPATDADLAATYDRSDRSGKAACPGRPADPASGSTRTMTGRSSG